MKSSVLVAVLAAVVLSAPCNAQQSMLGVNLVDNGTAEAGIGSPSCNTVNTPGWITTGAFTVGTYGGRVDVLSSNSPGPPLFGQNSRGKNFFCGGNGGSSQAKQTIDVSSLASTIDNGNLGFDLSGWLGGDGTSDDSATLSVTFGGQNSVSLGTVNLGPVKASDRSGTKSLVFKEQKGLVPAGTRTITVGLDMNRVDGVLNDAYADNISFVMDPPNIGSSTGGANIPGGGTTGSVTSVNVGSNTSATNSIPKNGPGLVAGLGQILGTVSQVLTNSGSLSLNGLNLSSASVGSGNAGTGNSGFSGGNLSSSSNFSGAFNPNNSALSSIVHERNKTIVILDSDKMFDKEKWSLGPASNQLLDHLRQTQFANHQKAIFFEGHTDEMSDNMDCLTLSMLRAATVADWMKTHGVDSAQFEVRGCGKTLPKILNINGANRSQNRRVEIVLLE